MWSSHSCAPHPGRASHGAHGRPVHSSPASCRPPPGVAERHGDVRAVCAHPAAAPDVAAQRAGGFSGCPWLGAPQ
eukprot:1137066-Pelagomonas_calceolata.AAC.5